MSEPEGHFELGSGWPLQKDEPGANRVFRIGRSRWLRAVMSTIAGSLLIVVGGVLGWRYWNTPRPLLEFPIGDAHVSDLRFSPDGATLAVTLRKDGTGIFRVSDGTLLQKLPGGALRCAWNADGSLLAVARSNWPDIELWDSHTWKLRKRLSLYDPKKGRTNREARLICASLSFDGWNNLYVVEESTYLSEVRQPDAFPYEIPRAAVFWRAGDAFSPVKAEHFLAVATVGDIGRLVCSGRDVEIWSVRMPKIGPGVIERKYAIPEVGSEDASVSLTADGKCLIACNSDRLFFVKLYDDHAEVIHSQQWHGDFPVWSTTDVAADGSVAAFRSTAGATVLGVPKARSLLEIHANAWIALSPDGRFLATKESGRQSVRIYRVPQ